MQHVYHIDQIHQKNTESVKPRSKPAELAQKFLTRITEAQEFASAAMAAAQICMEEKANKRRDPAPKFCVGDKVWLNLKIIHTPQPKKKLAWVNAKYKITRIISTHVVELDVPSGIWPRFHVELLRKASEDPLPSQYLDDSQPSLISVKLQDGSIQQEQVVERILRAEKFRRGKTWIRRVLVKWKNFAEPNWEDRSGFENVRALDSFEEIYGKGDGVGENEGARQGLMRNKRNKMIK